MNKELEIGEPIVPPMEGFWRTIFTELSNHPGCVLPVILLNPESYEIEGKFFASFAREGERKYIQIDSPTYSVNKLLTEKGPDWGFLPFFGGTFRLSVDSPLLGPLR